MYNKVLKEKKRVLGKETADTALSLSLINLIYLSLRSGTKFSEKKLSLLFFKRFSEYHIHYIGKPTEHPSRHLLVQSQQ